MNNSTENKEVKEAIETLKIYEEIWIQSLQSNLLKVDTNTFILSLYNCEEDKFLNHTIISLNKIK